MTAKMPTRNKTAISVMVEADVHEAWEAFVRLSLGKKRLHFVCALMAYMAIDEEGRTNVRQAYLDFLDGGDLAIPPLICRLATDGDFAREVEDALAKGAKKKGHTA